MAEEIPEIVIDMSANKIVINEVKKSLRDLAISKDILIFGQFLKNVRENFWGPRISNSLTLDLFAVYLNAQKILYIESKTHCEQLLNKIMLPAIFISLTASVVSLGMKATEYGSLIVAALSAFDAFLLAIISYTKLDAKAEAHKTSSYRFDKLQTKCEFYSGKVLLLEIERPAIDVTQEVSDFIETIEKQIDDIKDSNQFVIPEKIRYRYPETYSVNIFSEVKLLRNREKLFYNKLHTIYNKLETEKNEDILSSLEHDKEKTIVSMITLYDNYANLNNFINKEVKDYIAKSKKQGRICFWTTKKEELKCSDGKCTPKEELGSWMRTSSTSTRELPKDNESIDSTESPKKIGREWLKTIPPILRRI